MTKVSLAVIAIVVAAMYFIGRLPEDTAGKKCGGKIEAYVMSQGFMKQRLKSPGSAKFPSYSENGVNVEPQGDCIYAVVAFVDSENSFGALLRTRYSIEVEYLPSERSWTARDLISE